VRIYYTDGASLIIKSTEVDAVDYFRPSPGGGGAWVTFSKAQMPEEVMRRMGSVPRVIEALLGQHIPPRPASVR